MLSNVAETLQIKLQRPYNYSSPPLSCTVVAMRTNLPKFCAWGRTVQKGGCGTKADMRWIKTISNRVQHCQTFKKFDKVRRSLKEFDELRWAQKSSQSEPTSNRVQIEFEWNLNIKVVGWTSFSKKNIYTTSLSSKTYGINSTAELHKLFCIVNCQRLKTAVKKNVADCSAVRTFPPWAIPFSVLRQ